VNGHEIVETTRTGDLAARTLEAGRQERSLGRRSVGWYWREVSVAILVAFLQEWRILSWAFVSTMGWACLLRFWNTRWPFAYYVLRAQRVDATLARSLLAGV
jgi:hypothetical protein